MAPRNPGDFEYLLLRLLMDRPYDAYGASIQERLEAATGREYNIGAIYTALDRMEAKDFVRSWWGEPTAERGGRRKRHYEIKNAGREAVARKESAFSALPNFGAAMGVA